MFLRGIIHLLFAVSVGILPAYAATEATRTILVGFAQDTFANDWRMAQVETLRRELARIPNVTFLVTDGRGSTAQQIRDIEDMADRGVDILITSPRDERAMTPVLTNVYRSGIPVILLTRSIEGDSYSSYISPDDFAIGRAAAQHLAEGLRGKGRILILQGLPTSSTAKARTESFAMEARKHKGLAIVATKAGNYLRSDAIRAVEEAIREGIQFDAIYAQSDSMASGARIALEGAGRDPRKTLIVGIDYIREARAAIRNGQQSASFTYPTCAKEAASVVKAIITKKPVPKHVTVPSQKVTAANVDMVEPIF